MTVNTYLKRHPEIKAFGLQRKNAFVLCRTDSFDDMNCHGIWQISRVEEEPEELITLHVK